MRFSHGSSVLDSFHRKRSQLDLRATLQKTGIRSTVLTYICMLGSWIETTDQREVLRYPEFVTRKHDVVHCRGKPVIVDHMNLSRILESIFNSEDFIPHTIPHPLRDSRETGAKQRCSDAEIWYEILAVLGCLFIRLSSDLVDWIPLFVGSAPPALTLKSRRLVSFAE